MERKKVREREREGINQTYGVLAGCTAPHRSHGDDC